MGKVNRSGRWEGSITINSHLTYPQVIAYETAIAAGQEYLEEHGENGMTAVYNHLVLPGLIGCVEEWNLADFPETVTADTFPATPRVAAAKLMVWVIEAIRKVMRDDEEIPND